MVATRSRAAPPAARSRQLSATPAAAAVPSASAGQRGWKRHPPGMRVGSGISPVEHDRLEPLDLGHDGQQRLGVGMLRLLEHLLGGAALDHPAEVHHRDPVGDVPGQPEVVGHHHDAQTELLAQPEQQRQDLAADRGVERGDRLVGDQQLAGAGPSAPAMSTRCFWPPDSSCGYRRKSRSGGRSPASRKRGRDELGLAARPPRRTRRACAAGCPRPRTRRRSAAGSASPRRPAGSAAPRLRNARSPPDRVVQRRAVEEHLAGVGRCSPTRVRASVVLPEPDSPTSATISPRLHARVDAVQRPGDGARTRGDELHAGRRAPRGAVRPS